MQMGSKKTWFYILAALIVGVAAIWSMSPSSTPKGATKLLPLEEALGKTAAARRSSKKMEEDSKGIGPRVEKLAYIESAEELTPMIIEELQKIADKSGVHIREIKPLKAKLIANGTGTRVPIEVRFRSNFQPNVVQFLYEVEDPAGKMVVEKINITSADSKFKTVEVSAQITVFTKSTVGTSNGDAGDTGDVRINRG